MQSFEIEELFFAAAEDEKIIDQLCEELLKLPNLSSEEIASGIEFLMEAWGESIETSRAKSGFCLALAEMNPPDSRIFRISLHRALNCLKTSDFMKSTVIKAAGIKEKSLTLGEIAERFTIMEKLKPGIYIYNPASNRIGEIVRLDAITSEITVKWKSASASTTMTLQTALDDLLFLNRLDSLKKDLSLPVDEWKKELAGYFFTDVDETVLKRLSSALAMEAGISNKLFSDWWEGCGKDGQDDQKKRHPAEARTLHEINTLLKNYSGGSFSEEECRKLHTLFASLKFKQSSGDMIMLAESLVALSEYITEEELLELGALIKEKVLFWPQPPERGEALYVWENLPARLLTHLAELTSALFSDDYTASLILCLPLRCWNSILTAIDIQCIIKTIAGASSLSADALLWIWKNRKKLPEDIITRITPDVLRRALDSSGSQSVPELKELFISDKAFQKMLLSVAEGSEMDILRAVQACDTLKMDEKQSILVKFSSLSSTVKRYIEKGEGKKMFAAAGRKHAAQQAADAPDITSIISFTEMTEALNDIINRQIPENSAAIAHARSYGDLRENAEYKAAKERQAFLQKRRAELEKGIMNTQPVDFSLEQPDKKAVPGSTVTLTYDDDGSVETFYLLGVWDSAPENNCIAYTSGLGKVINGKNTNDKVVLPDGRDAVITNIEPLPEKLIRKLNSEPEQQ